MFDFFFVLFALLCLRVCASYEVSGGPSLYKTGIYSRQDAKNAKSGSLISLRPLRRRSGHALRLCARYSEFWLQLYHARQLQFPSRPATFQRILDIVLE